MALTINNQPNNFSPIQAPVWYKITSGSSSASDFQYVYDVYVIDQNTQASTFINRYPIPPRPNSGESVFTPNEILKSFISYDFNPTLTNFTTATNSIVEYQVVFGESYNPGLTFSDTINESGYVGLTFSTAHGLLVSDIITIDKTNKQINPSYDGTASVTQVINTYEVKTDVAWGDSTTNETGSITNLIRMSATSSKRFAFNGTRQYLERSKSYAGYEINSGTQSPLPSFLSNYNDAKQVFTYSYETLSFMIGSASTTTPNLGIIDFYDNNLNYVYTATVSNSFSASNYKRQDWGVGPQNLSNAGITFSLAAPYYYVSLANGNNQISTTKLYKMVNNCSPYSNVLIGFKNALGGFDYWNFNWKSSTSYNIQRNEYKKVLDWNYNVGERGYTQYSQNVTQVNYASTDWISEYDSLFLKELLLSDQVFVVDGIYSLPIIITDNSYNVKTYLNDKLFCLSINYKFSFDINAMTL
jgi:hypothetical protein